MRLSQALIRLIFLMTLGTLVHAQEAEETEETLWAENIHRGDMLPAIEAKDQYGEIWNNKRLQGQNGLVLVFVRSTDW